MQIGTSVLLFCLASVVLAQKEQTPGQPGGRAVLLQVNESAAPPAGWESRLRKLDAWLAKRAFARHAEDLLSRISDPSAVPAIMRVYGTGGADQQTRAIQLLGQIECESSSRALAGIAIATPFAVVRNAALAQVVRRNPIHFADVFIAEMVEPITYRVKQVDAPGATGVVTVETESSIEEHIYLTPEPPDLPFGDDDFFTLDPQGMPVFHGHADSIGLPMFWDTSCGLWPSNALILPHVPVVVPLSAMWQELDQTVKEAQRKIREEEARLKRFRADQLASNEQIASILNRASGLQLPASKEAWRAWWYEKTGRQDESLRRPVKRRTVKVVPLDYLPQSFGHIGFDPEFGYFVTAASGR